MVVGHGRRGGQIGRGGSSTERGGSSTARPAGEKTEADKIKSDAARLPQPQFTPGDYLDDADLERLLPQVGVNAGLAPGDFVEERNLDTMVGLVSRSSQRDADKADE
jgi:hypothetical protein